MDLVNDGVHRHQRAAALFGIPQYDECGEQISALQSTDTDFMTTGDLPAQFASEKTTTVELTQPRNFVCIFYFA